MVWCHGARCIWLICGEQVVRVVHTHRKAVDIILFVVPHFPKVLDNFFLLLPKVLMGRHPGGECLLAYLVVQFTQPGVNGVHLWKRVPELVYGHLAGGNPLPYLVQIVQPSKVDSAPSFVKPW